MTAPLRTMDLKLARVRAGAYKPTDFIIADAKDGDMSGGTSSPGLRFDERNQPSDRMRPIADYRADMRRIVESRLVDIMLTSLSSAEALMSAGVFVGSDVTPAVRLNDATDIWVARGATYRNEQARPFRTARLDRARALADLGLYAITFYNDVDRDVETLRAYSEFRDEAERVGMRHFLEVFNPAFEVKTNGADWDSYLNDAISRCLAGVATADRPLFLKMTYNGPRAMDELASFDPEHLIVGILGGAAGTTRDTFELVSQAEHHGARVALFGRKIYFAESSVEIVRCMRLVVERKTSPAEAVKIYHDQLKKEGIIPRRDLADDAEITEPVLKAGAER
jgi:DhnA family fructose-bisphosphate aldolase class Ia